MKWFMMLFKLCVSLNLINIIYSVYRSETYKFFDKFYLVDIVYSLLYSYKHLRTKYQIIIVPCQMDLIVIN